MKKMSTYAKVRKMVKEGHTTKEIVKKLGVTPQSVYNARYQLNKNKGIGSFGVTTPNPASGIGKPSRRGRKPKSEGTGLTPTPSSNERDKQSAPPLVMLGPEHRYPGAIKEINLPAPAPSLWSRIVGFFRG